MLSELHLLAENICRRKASNWTDTRNIENLTDIATLFDYCHKTLIKWLDELENDQKNWQQINPKIANLIAVKIQLDKLPWKVPKSKQNEILTSFTHDLLCYLMLIQLLKISYRLYTGFCDTIDKPSYCLLKPYWNIPEKQCQKLLNQFYQTFPWLNEYVSCHPSELETLITQFESLTNNIPDGNPILPLLYEWRQSLLILPNNRAKEKEYTNIIQQLIFNLENILNDNYWPEYRNLIYNILCSNHAVYLTSYDYIHLYNQLFPTSTINAVDELEFWKQASKSPKSEKPHPKIIREMLSQFKIQLKNQVQQVNCKANLVWTGHPYEYARLILKLIRKGLLTLNGCSDVTPIVNNLHSFIKVEKVNKSGFAKIESILTYFKKISSGDI